MTDPFADRSLAHYRIAHRLGAGGMGVVYAAHDLRLDRRVAIKILAETDGAAPDCLANLLNTRWPICILQSDATERSSWLRSRH